MNTRPLSFTVYPKKSRLLLLLAGSLAFVAISVLMIRDGERMGWLGAIFFGMCLLIFLLQLLPGSSFLTVDNEGLEICSLFRSHRLRWSDIEGFGTYTISQNGLPVNKRVGLNYTAEYQRASKMRALSKALAGFEGGLPDTYGFRAEELALLLSDIHRERLKRDAQ